LGRAGDFAFDEVFFAADWLVHHTHTRVFVQRSVFPEEVKSLDLDGLQMFAMNGEHFFVSPSLKFALEANEFSYLESSEGLTGFAGAALYLPKEGS
jgi:hypothetical protein